MLLRSRIARGHSAPCSGARVTALNAARRINGNGVAPVTLLAQPVSARFVVSVTRAAVLLVSIRKAAERESQWGDKLGMVPGWVLHNEPGSEPPAPPHLTQARLNLTRLHGKKPQWLRWCGASFFYFFCNFFFCFAHLCRRDVSWRTNDTGSPHGFIPLKERKKEKKEATTVSLWRLHNSQEFSRIWKGTKSDPCLRWVCACNSEVLVCQI